MPNILWIWDLKTFKLMNVLIQTMAIKCKQLFLLRFLLIEFQINFKKILFCLKA